MGPLHGMKVVEFEGIGPGPMCAMLLADLGAEVLLIERVTPSQLGQQRPLKYNLTRRNRSVIALDLKKPEAVAVARKLVSSADALIEGFRPGVMERLGLGPEVCMEDNPRLVYGRMTGWGQDGPLSTAAAHDINYISLPGALNAIGRRGQPPTHPLNLLGDFGGGAMYLAFGIMCALFERNQSGRGQVIDAAIVDGVASLLTAAYGMFGAGLMGERGTNATDTGSHFCNAYQCADGKWISLCALESKFYDKLMELLPISSDAVGDQWDRDNWENAKARFAELFATKTQKEWCDLLEGTDCCFAPLLSFDEAPRHPHLAARETFIEVEGVVQPAPAPRFSRSKPEKPTPPASADPGTYESVLADWLSPQDIATAREIGTLG